MLGGGGGEEAAASLAIASRSASGAAEETVEMVAISPATFTFDVTCHVTPVFHRSACYVRTSARILDLCQNSS